MTKDRICANNKLSPAEIEKLRPFRAQHSQTEADLYLIKGLVVLLNDVLIDSETTCTNTRFNNGILALAESLECHVGITMDCLEGMYSEGRRAILG